MESPRHFNQDISELTIYFPTEIDDPILIEQKVKVQNSNNERPLSLKQKIQF